MCLCGQNVKNSEHFVVSNATEKILYIIRNSLYLESSDCFTVCSFYDYNFAFFFLAHYPGTVKFLNSVYRLQICQ